MREVNRINKQLEVYKKLQNFFDTPNKIKNWRKKYVY
jgi:hypothetical protein